VLGSNQPRPSDSFTAVLIGDGLEGQVLFGRGYQPWQANRLAERGQQARPGQRGGVQPGCGDGLVQFPVAVS
jgi:hypothetical protein